MKELSKKSFWIKLFLSYLAVLAFSLVIGMILYRSSLSRIQESTEKYSRFALLQVNESISQMEESIQILPDNLSVRAEYLSLVYADPDLTSYKREKISQLQKELTRQVAHNNYVSGMYIWFGHPQLAISTRGMIKGIESMEKVLQEEFGITLEQAESWSNKSNGLVIRLLGSAPFADNAIAITRGEKSSAVDAPLIIMKLRLSAWLDILTGGRETTVGHDAVLWIESNDEKFFLVPDGVGELALFVDQRADLEGQALHTRFGNEDLILMGMNHGDNFSIISAWDYGTYTKTQKQYQKIAVIFLSAYLILGAAIAMILTRINYGPVEGLTNLILDRVNAVSGDEFAMLEAGINSLLKYSQDYEQAKVKEKKMLKEKCLVSLLLGEVEKEDFSGVCGEHGLHFLSDRFAVVVAAIKDSSHLLFGEMESRKMESVDISLFAISSVTEELLGEIGSAFACRQEGKIWILVSPPRQESQEEFHGRVLEACEKAESFLREEMGIHIRIYVSDLSRTAQKSSGIHIAYQNAHWGMEQIESYNIQSGVNDSQSVESHISPTIKAPRDDAGVIRRQLFSAVTAGDFKEAEILYLRLRRQDIEFSDSSFATVKAQSLMLVGYFVSFLPEEAEKLHHQEIKEYVNGIRLESQDEKLMARMKDWMVYFHGLYEEVEQRNKQNAGKEPAADAARYINSHYSDMSLSVSKVAESLSVSSSYLSRSFQKKYGISVLQYIHQRRIDMAKVLLRESSNTIEQIAGQVGYVNSLALIRAFKRYQNCAPTEYRNSLKEKEDTITP